MLWPWPSRPWASPFCFGGEKFHSPPENSQPAARSVIVWTIEPVVSAATIRLGDDQERAAALQYAAAAVRHVALVEGDGSGYIESCELDNRVDHPWPFPRCTVFPVRDGTANPLDCLGEVPPRRDGRVVDGGGLENVFDRLYQDGYISPPNFS